MLTRALGDRGIHLTELGYGAAVLGNQRYAISDEDALAAVDAAWDSGIRHFDTAPHYGLGLSERRLGLALAHRPRDEFVLSTKVGRLLVPADQPTARDDNLFDVPGDLRRVWDFSRDGVLRCIDASLDRLQLDRIDIVYMHDPDEHWEAAIGQALPVLAELREQHVVVAIGAGMNQPEMLARFIREADVDVVMIAGRLTLLDQSALVELVPAAREHRTSVVAAAVFNSGLLATPRPVPGVTYNYRDVPAEVLERTALLADMCDRHGTTLPAVALAYPLQIPEVKSVVVGMRTAAEVHRNVELLAAEVPDAFWQELRSANLLAPTR